MFTGLINISPHESWGYFWLSNIIRFSLLITYYTFFTLAYGVTAQRIQNTKAFLN